jgi:4a-hydroxytetrahydrobiopterin dehydratase
MEVHEVKTLSEAEIKAELARSGAERWSVQGGKLHREYAFEDFVHAFGFMATAAVAIEAMNHHPEWSNVWNRVRVDLVTHDAGGITEKDVELAAKLEGFARKLGGTS